MPHVSELLCFGWLDPQFINSVKQKGQLAIDWIQQGFCKETELHLYRSFVLLATSREVPPLEQILKEDAKTVGADTGEGPRVRTNEDWPETNEVIKQDETDEDDIGPSV